MTRTLSICTVLLVAGSAAAEEQKPAHLIESEALKPELKKVVEKLAERMSDDEKKALGLTKKDDIRERLEKDLQPLLWVESEEREKRLQNKQFDDKDNLEKMNHFRDLFKEMKIEIPKVVQLFNEELDKGELKGVRLELAMQANTVLLRKTMEPLLPKDPPAEKAPAEKQ